MNEDFVRVAEKKELQPSTMKFFDFAGEREYVLLIQIKIIMQLEMCVLIWVEPLDEGSLERYDVKSPWHSSKFDVMAENVTNPPAQEPVASFEVRIEGSDILLRKRQELQILFENILLK